MDVVFHVLNAAKALVIADAVMSWFLADFQFPRNLTRAVLDPVYAPVRSLVGSRVGPIDMAPLIALGILFAFEATLRRSGHRPSR